MSTSSHYLCVTLCFLCVTLCNLNYQFSIVNYHLNGPPTMLCPDLELTYVGGISSVLASYRDQIPNGIYNIHTLHFTKDGRWKIHQ